jgi:hypothetical protein
VHSLPEGRPHMRIKSEAALSQAMLGRGALHACLPKIATAFLPEPVIQHFEK